MKIKSSSLTLILAAVAVWITSASIARAQHGHLNAGALGGNLVFANGADFATNSGYLVTLSYTNGGTYAGYFNANLTLTALPATGGNGGPDPAAAALGSFIRVELTSVSGPVGGSFGFWATGATSPTISLASGQMGTSQWDLSGPGAGVPGADPFGHIHGRRFSVTQPGVYTVGFTLYDVSTNGIGGAPIQTPSDTLYVNFVAIPEPSSMMLVGVGIMALGWKLRRRSMS